MRCCTVVLPGKMLCDVGHANEPPESAPQDISALLDALDEHPIVVGSSQGEYLLGKMRIIFLLSGGACHSLNQLRNGAGDELSVLIRLVRSLFGALMYGNSCSPNRVRLLSDLANALTVVLFSDLRKTQR